MNFLATIFALVVALCPISRAQTTHEVSQHVHLSSVDEGHAFVQPAPKNTVHVEMRNIGTRILYTYCVEYLGEDAISYSGCFTASHKITHGAYGPSVFAGSQTGTTCGDSLLQSFDGTLDYAGTSGHTTPALFTTQAWAVQDVTGNVSQWKRHRAGELHELVYSPVYQDDELYCDENGNPLDEWDVAEQWFPQSATDFDLIYIVAD